MLASFPPLSMFYLSLATLVIAMLGGFYLLFEWLRHGRRYKFLILWAAGFFSLYLFQIPAILANGGVGFVLTNFNPFFLLAIPLTVLGLFLIYGGILSVLRAPTAGKMNRYLFLWPIVSFAFFTFYFSGASAITIYTPLFITIFLFYLPLELLILTALWRWYREQNLPTTRFAKIGILAMIISISFGVIRDFISVPRILAYPPEFWFVAYISFKPFFILQALSLILLIGGFFLVHRNCCKILDEYKRAQ